MYAHATREVNSYHSIRSLLRLLPWLLALLLGVFLAQPVAAADLARMHTPQTPGGQPSGMGMMGGEGMQGMSMADMGAKMDEMAAKMARMGAGGTVTETMTLAEMGHMMQMMGMMAQRMSAMQAQMGQMMAGESMAGGMMGEGMMGGGGMMGEGMSCKMSCMDKGSADEEAAAPEEAADPHAGHTAGAPAEATAEPAAPAEGGEDAAPAGDAAADPHANHPTPAFDLAPQRAEAGAVVVEAAFVPSDDVLEVIFAVKLETHSVELDFDLAQQATLTIGTAQFATAAWEPDAPSGHHVSGTLRFTIDHPAHGAMAEGTPLTLALGEIDGTAVSFEFAPLPE